MHGAEEEGVGATDQRNVFGAELLRHRIPLGLQVYGARYARDGVAECTWGSCRMLGRRLIWRPSMPAWVRVPFTRTLRRVANEMASMPTAWPGDKVVPEGSPRSDAAWTVSVRPCPARSLADARSGDVHNRWSESRAQMTAKSGASARKSPTPPPRSGMASMLGAEARRLSMQHRRGAGPRVRRRGSRFSIIRPRPIPPCRQPGGRAAPQRLRPHRPTAPVARAAGRAHRRPGSSTR